VSAERGVALGPESLALLADYASAAEDPVAGALAAKALARFAASPLRGQDGLFFLAPLTGDTALVDREVNLAMNARWLAAFSRVGLLTGRRDLGEVAKGLGEAMRVGLAFVESGLLAAGWAGFRGSASPEGRRFVLQDGAGGALADTVAYSGWNALASSGFVACYRVTRQPRWLIFSRQIHEAIQKGLADSSGGFRHCADGDGPLLLSDQALIARAALDLYDAEARAEDLQLARNLANRMLDGFAGTTGPLRDRAPDAGEVVAPGVDRLLPAANGVAAQVLLRLHAHTGDGDYRAAAQRILAALIGPNLDRAAHMGALGRALVLHLRPDEGADPSRGK
jgi:hypothetical protein